MVKVPPPKQPPPQAEKDRTLTRRTVAGAAGGLKGVDYEDDRRPDPSASGPAAASSPKAARLVRDLRGEEKMPMPGDIDRTKGVLIERGYQAAEDEPIVDEVPKKKKRAKGMSARDRMSIDKDAPELRRVRKWAEEDDEDEELDEEELELVVSDERDRIERGPSSAQDSRAHLFAEDSRPEPGDLSLTEPDEIARVLGSPLAYAKHAMILAEAFRRTTGATRGEAIEYLARMFIAPSDKSFGRLAIKEFGPSSGILDIYPLEVMEHVLDRYPGFLPKVGYGRLFANVPAVEEETIYTDTRTPVMLEYSVDLKIRAFAVSGGGRPGYLLEPDLEPGKYRLHIYTSGKYRVLISAINEHGYTTIDRLRIQVRPRKVEDLGTSGSDEEIYPERSEDLVQAWPVPEIDVLPEDLSEGDVALIAEAVAEVIEVIEESEQTAPEIDADELEEALQAPVEITQRITLEEEDEDEDEFFDNDDETH